MLEIDYEKAAAVCPPLLYVTEREVKVEEVALKDLIDTVEIPNVPVSVLSHFAINP